MSTAVKKFVMLAMTLACVTVAWPALAQQAVRVEPKPLDADDPLAKRAAVLVKQMLAGEKAAALKTLHAEGDEAFVKNPETEKLVDAQIARLGKAKYAIREFETGIGSDVVVLLEATGGAETNIVIRFNDAKKIVGFAQVQINGG
jgi:hypothetical protein